MVRKRANKVWRAILITLGAVIVLLAIAAAWVAANYRQQLSRRLPAMFEQATDSLYTISWTGIEISLLKGTLSVTGLSLVPNKKRMHEARDKKLWAPGTVSTLHITEVRVYGISWWPLITKRSLSCDSLNVYSCNWLLENSGHKSVPKRRVEGNGKIDQITIGYVNVYDPEISYRVGEGKRVAMLVEGGEIRLRQWQYNIDNNRDTCSFLFAQSGHVRLKKFVQEKATGTFFLKDFSFDFSLNRNALVLEQFDINGMTNTDPISNRIKEEYNIKFPRITIAGWNWNKLTKQNTLYASEVNLYHPSIDIWYQRAYNIAGKLKMGTFPQQLLQRISLQIHIGVIKIEQGLVKVTEVTPDEREGDINFNGINGNIYNVTNRPELIKKNGQCKASLTGIFEAKTELKALFNFWLDDTTGRFTMNGSLENLDNKDVEKQVQAFTNIEITSFHLYEMDIHIQGNENLFTGQFSTRYRDLKLSFTKLDDEMRNGHKGLLSVVGNVVLFPHNPMPNEAVRSSATSLARDNEKGFFGNIWKSILRGAKKTAVRDAIVLNLTVGKENKPGDTKVHKGFFRRLFGKK